MAQSMKPAQMMDAAALSQQYKNLSKPVNQYAIQDVASSTASKFPVQLGSIDPEDETYGLRKKIVGNDGVVKGVGQAVATQDYFDYEKRKMDMARQVEFESWLMNQANFSDPAEAQFWAEKMPWMITKRMEEIEKQALLQKNLARIQITGPQTEEDFLMVFMMEQGMLGVIDKPLHKLNEGTYQDNFQAGIFSLFTDPNKALPAKANAKKIAWGNPLFGGTAIPGRAGEPNTWLSFGNITAGPPSTRNT